MSQFDNVSVIQKANVYFDGKCVSHTVILAGGVRKSVGVILPSTLTFNTDAPERMEIVAGSCRYMLAGAADWKTVKAGESFDVPGKSSFQIEQTEPLHYVCHFG
ncbi:MAG: pyrimidine/purine nucleoside phosphorylase [Burkholderiales bacterium]